MGLSHVQQTTLKSCSALQRSSLYDIMRDVAELLVVLFFKALYFIKLLVFYRRLYVLWLAEAVCVYVFEFNVSTKYIGCKLYSLQQIMKVRYTIKMGSLLF